MTAAIAAAVTFTAATACSGAARSSGVVHKMSPASPSALGEPPPPSPARPIRGEPPQGNRTWRAVAISADGNVRAYQHSVYVKSGDSDGPLYVWDRGTNQLTFVSDNVEPMTIPALSRDGRVVVFAEERDSMTKRDGVNTDPDVHRIVRWTATTGATPLTGFNYEAVPRIATSGDGRVVAFAAFEKNAHEPYETFVIEQDAPAVRVSPPSKPFTGSGWSLDEQIVAVSRDGRRIAFMQWQEDRSMAYIRDLQGGGQRAIEDIVRGVTGAAEVSLSDDGSRLAVRLRGGEWDDGTVAVVEVDTGKVLARSRPFLHPDAHTERGRNLHISGDGDLLAYEAPGESDGMSLDAGELFKPDILIVIQVSTRRAKYVEPEGYLFDLLQDGRLVVGNRLYTF